MTPAPSPLPTPSTGGTPDISGWTVAWADEFNGDTLDVNLWGKYLGPSPRNNEKNYYTADDVYLSNGKLVIRQQKRVYGSGTDQRQYTSGQVISKKLIGGRPTRVDIRVKAPRGQGLHSGYWAYPNASNTWPPEIDFLEVIGSQPTTGNYTWHYGSDWTSHKSIGNWFPGPDFTTSFNDITVEYDSTKIVWYLNGQERFRVTSNLAQVLNSMNVLLDTSIGGDWPGLPDSTTVFPSYNEIDYFRVYVK